MYNKHLHWDALKDDKLSNSNELSNEPISENYWLKKKKSSTERKQIIPTNTKCKECRNKNLQRMTDELQRN